MISVKKLFALSIAVLTILCVCSTASQAGVLTPAAVSGYSADLPDAPDSSDIPDLPDEGDAGCECGSNADVCDCDTGAAGGCDCGRNGCDNGDGLRIVSDTVHYLVLGQPFITDLEAEGGTAPYVWSAENGDLPRGLVLSPDSLIEGTPESAGSFRVTVRVTDSATGTASKRFTFLVVENEELAVMTDTLPDAQVGLFYTARVRGCGGTKPYGWTIDNLPGWLSLDADSGILSGLPPEAGIHDLTVRLTDGERAADSKLLRLSVYPHDGLHIETLVLPAAIYGQGYSTRLEASGGIPPRFFSPRRGSSLPPGLSLNNVGSISGTPAQKGVHDFVIDATDGNNLQGSATFTMVVLDPDTTIPGNDDFIIQQDEDEKRVRLNFHLPKEFDDAQILAVETLTSPDAYVARSVSRVTKEESGIYKVEMTLYAAEYALDTGGGNLETLMKELSLEGFVVLFRNGSGEKLRFEESLLFSDLKKAEEDSGKSGGGGGCNAGWGLSALSLLPLALKSVLKKGTQRR